MVEFALRGPGSHAAPAFERSFKVARTVAAGIATGIEYYCVLGTSSDIEPWSDQKNTLYWAVDIARKPCNLNFRIGRGLTPVTDCWTVKLIAEIPLEG